MPSPDITDGIPYSIGLSTASLQYTSDTIDFDYAVNGQPFLAYASPDDAIQRALAPIRKQQVDQSDNPGEQSLDSWWLRSQTDWSGGAGLSFMEPASDARVQRQFHSSAGVNVWEIGQVSLLRALTSQRVGTGSNPTVVRYNHTTGLYFGAGTAIDLFNGSSWSTTTGFSGTVASLLMAGSKVLALNTSGAIYSATVGGSTFSSLWTTASGATKAWWVKQRLIVAQGADLLEIGLGGGDLDAQTPYYTHPDTSWVWTAAFEAPGAILVAGYGAAGSAIYKFILDPDGTLPTISGAITTAEFPVGEYITGGATYLGAYIALATNLGVRVGTVAANGDVSYGPFTYEGATAGGFVPFSRFVYTGVADAGDGRPGLIRIDLSDIGDDGRAPWANDVRFAGGVGGSVTSFTVLSEDRVYVANSNSTLYGCTASSNLEADGWLRTGYIRYGTIEKKNYESVKVEMSKPVYGSLTVSSVDKDGNTSSLGYFGSGVSLDESLKISYPTAPQKHLALKFTLLRDATTPTLGPVLENWQMRAIPSPTRSELQQIPMLCYDFEEDSHGQRWGSEGNAILRWQALRDAVADSQSITFQNFRTGERITSVVEELSFRQTSGPSSMSGFGGVVLLTLRSL